MFLENKYTTWYYGIINQAKQENRQKTKQTYLENHHIIPTCVGGSNDKSNRVNLTYREHFLCHWLLTKMVSDREILRKFQYAISRMSKNKISDKPIVSWQYALMRKSTKEAMTGRIVRQETKDKGAKWRAANYIGSNNPFYGKTHTEENKQKARERMVGKIIHPFYGSIDRHPFLGKKRPEHSKRMKIIMKGRKFTKDHRDNLSKTWHESRTRMACEHCHKITTKSMNTRWHGIKCKTLVEGRV